MTDSKIAAASKKSEPFRRALTEVWRVSLYGEGKHGANNWMQAKPEGMHYYEDALWRHLQLRRLGNVMDDESKLRHLAHAAWSALMLLEMEVRGVTNPEWKTDGQEPAPSPGPVQFCGTCRHAWALSAGSHGPCSTCTIEHLRWEGAAPRPTPEQEQVSSVCLTCSGRDK